MVRPQEVKAPKEKIEVLAILEDGTPAWFVLPDKLTELYSKDYKELINTMRFIEDLDK